MRPRSLVVAVIAVCLAAARPAHADTAPWSVGVTAAQKARAKEFLDAGNALLLDKKFALALEKYNDAVAEWNHPAIRFNIVRCLIQLDRLAEASDNLKLALAYGAAPLEEAIYNEALAYEKLLAKQTGEVVVSCTQSGVKLTLDGKALPACPTSGSHRVAIGAHQLVGTKEGLLTRTIEVVVVGGAQQRVGIKLEPLASAARIEHRWASWVPWTVFGSGFLIGGIGAAVQLSAMADRDFYMGQIEDACSTFTCTENDPALVRIRGLDDQARRKGLIAGAVLGVGAATVATGIVLLFMNRGRTVYPQSVERVSPTVSVVPGGATLTIGRAF